MQRIDGYYLYELGYKIHGISEIKIFPSAGNPLHNCRQALGYLYPALFSLDQFTTGSVYRFRTIEQAAIAFRGALNTAIDHCSIEGKSEDIPSTDTMFELQEKHLEFEFVLKAELATENLYLIQQKSAFDTQTLIISGERAFPSDLEAKAPDAIEDLRQGMRCIAFELPTAAAFHMHRANEVVLGYYWDAVTKGEKRPKNQTLGAYIHELEGKKLGPKPLMSALRDIKDLHRNPTIHSDQTLETVEEAINLQGAIRAALGAMLSSIPEME